jgi:hypothetical protein
MKVPRFAGYPALWPVLRTAPLACREAPVQVAPEVHGASLTNQILQFKIFLSQLAARSVVDPQDHNRFPLLIDTKDHAVGSVDKVAKLKLEFAGLGDQGTASRKFFQREDRSD